jgi:hypothetical protein
MCTQKWESGFVLGQWLMRLANSGVYKVASQRRAHSQKRIYLNRITLVSENLLPLWNRLMEKWITLRLQYVQGTQGLLSNFFSLSNSVAHVKWIGSCSKKGWFPSLPHQFFLHHHFRITGFLDFVSRISFRKLDLFPPSGEGKEIPKLLGPSESSNFIHLILDVGVVLLVWDPGDGFFLFRLRNVTIVGKFYYLILLILLHVSVVRPSSSRNIQCVHKVHSGFWKIVARKQIELAICGLRQITAKLWKFFFWRRQME